MRNIFRILCLLLLCNVAALAQTNTLTVPDVIMNSTGRVMLPIQLDNTSEVVAMQFTLTIPEDFTIEGYNLELTDRMDGHSIRTKQMSDGRYMVMVMSGENKAIKGNTGTLYEVPLCVIGCPAERSVHQMGISDVVITNANGDNVATSGSKAGKITVEDLADIEVCEVSASTTNIVPGQDVEIFWTLKNNGHKTFEGDWYAYINIVTEYASHNISYDSRSSSIEWGNSEKLSSVITIPDVLNLDGESRIEVSLHTFSNANEPAWLRDNNRAISNATYDVAKLLKLSPVLKNIKEEDQQVQYYLQRSGDYRQSEAFAITTTNDSRVSLPSSVTIPSYSSYAYFYADVSANKQIDEECVVNISAEGNGYDAVKAQLVIEDDTTAPFPFTVELNNPESWNDFNAVHKLTISGTFENARGNNGHIEYAMQDSYDWKTLTADMAPGTEFTANLDEVFGYYNALQKIRFRRVDVSGSIKTIAPLVFKNIRYHALNGIEAKNYNYGDSIYQDNLTIDLDEAEYALIYQNNVNAGSARIYLDGVFPYSFGRSTYYFDINRLPMPGGGITVEQGPFAFSRSYQYPSWQFQEANTLVNGTDYLVNWYDNYYPGTATVEVVARGNYYGTFSATFPIVKAVLSGNFYRYSLPEADIVNDGEQHAASVTYKWSDVGEPVITYVNTATGTSSTTAPSADGEYDVYIRFLDNNCYYGTDDTKIGSFGIYTFDDAEWTALGTIYNAFNDKGWTAGWDMTNGKKSVKSLSGLTVEKGHVTSINLSRKNIKGEMPDNLSAFTKLTNLNLSYNELTGNVGTLAANFPSLQSLNVSHNMFTEVSPMIPATVTSFNSSYQAIDKTLGYDLANFDAEEFYASIPTILTYDHNNQQYRKRITLNCSSDTPEYWSFLLDYNDGEVSMYNNTSGQVYKGESGNVFTAKPSSGVSSESTINVRLLYANGDVNMNGPVDAADLQTIIKYIFNEYYGRFFCFATADIENDDMINVQDVVGMVDVLLASNEEDASSAPSVQKMKAQASDHAVAEAYVFVQDGYIVLQSDREIAALDLAVSSDVKWLNESAMQFSTTGRHLVAYSLFDNTFPAGTTILAKCNPGTRVTKVSASDIQANNISIKAGTADDANVILNIDATRAYSDGIYDAAGRQHNSTVNGLNITRDGKKFVKK